MSNVAVSYMRQELLTLRKHLGLPRYLVGSVLLTFLVFCVLLSSTCVLCAQCC